MFCNSKNVGIYVYPVAITMPIAVECVYYREMLKQHLGSLINSFSLSLTGG